MKCSTCGEENPVGTRFCRRCGAPMAPGGAGMRKLLPLIAAAIVLGAAGFFLMARHTVAPPAAPAAPAAQRGDPDAAPAGAAPGAAAAVTVGVAYGTEKRDWLTWAAAEFAKTPDGKIYKIDLKPLGSLEAANAIVHGDQSIQVWSPASSLYKDVFVRDWKDAHGQVTPIAYESPLALTPMVFVVWQQRYEAFITRYKELNFRTIGQAVNEEGGWNAIASKPDWMFFKFSHTNPVKSNSGLATLVLMGYDFHGKGKNLGGADITEEAFQDWVRSIERALSGAASGLTDSTGTLMNSMVQRGPSTYDVIFVYENVAIDRLKQAEGRWGDLRVVYPRYNMWNDNPYYVLEVPWSSAAQRQGARAFCDFLLSEPVQREAMAHGFRPANVQVPTNGPDSPFIKYGSAGIRADVPGLFCDPPKADVIDNLLLAWQRSQADVH